MALEFLGLITAKPVLPVKPALPINEYDPFPGRTVPTIESPTSRMRRARLGASLHSYGVTSSIRPHFVLLRSTYLTDCGWFLADQLFGLRSAKSDTSPLLHPSGKPSSSSLAGNKRARVVAFSGGKAWPMMAAGSVAPSIWRRVGPKSTNQSRNNARAISSNVSFIRRFSSILSSSADSVAAIFSCSAFGGQRNGIFFKFTIVSACWVEPILELSSALCPAFDLNQ
mmetsp:Transcript_23662/g.42116  ORF Transcript_23662/g.42116 Transcript_23662/m.42116 type:complete len:226 (-) Transcript_23662:596-1273(-)